MEYKYIFDVNTCLYNQNCKMQTDTPEKCNPMCPRHMEMHYHMNTTGIPINLRKPTPLVPEEEDRQAFIELREYRQDIKSHVEKGDNLFIYSENTGNGKTSWAVKILVSFFDKNWIGNGRRDLGYFVSVPALLMKMKAFSEHDEEWLREKNKIRTVPLVVFDDLGANKLSDFDHANLFNLIDTRINNGLSNIFTSNLGEETLPVAIGERLFSRVWGTSKHIRFVGADRRINK